MLTFTSALIEYAHSALHMYFVPSKAKCRSNHISSSSYACLCRIHIRNCISCYKTNKKKTQKNITEMHMFHKCCMSYTEDLKIPKQLILSITVNVSVQYRIYVVTINFHFYSLFGCCKKNYI